jgi:alpha/beta hydrolase fold
MDTVSVARDHEALRRALGENKINWLGISYGTQLGANYAPLYPSHTRAMVLDAALEHSLPEGHQVAGEIVAAEDSFNRFADWCRPRRPVRYAAKTYGQSSIAWWRKQIKIRFPLRVRCGQSPVRTSGWARKVCCGSRSLRSMDLTCHGLGCRGRYRRRSTVMDPPSQSPQQELPSTDTMLCSATPVWTTHRRCAPIRTCSSGSSLASTRTSPAGCIRDLAGRVVHRLAGATSQPTQNAERPGSADLHHPGSSRSIDSLLLGTWPRSTDRGQRTVDAYG